MNPKTSVLVATFLSLTYLPMSSCRASTLYASSGLPGVVASGKSYYSIDQNTAATTTLSSNTYGEDLTSDWRPDSFRMWAIYGNELIAVDPLTGNQPSVVLASDQVYALAFDVTSGNLYGAGIGRGDSFFRINPSNGVLTAIGFTGFFGVRSLAADLSGNLFGVSGSTLIRIDPTTGHGQSVGTVPIGIQDLAVRPEDGTMFAVQNLTVNSTPSYRLLTVDTTTVPEPSVTSLMIGAVAYTFLGRRPGSNYSA